MGVIIAVTVVIRAPPGVVGGILAGTVSWGISELFHDFLESHGWGIGAWKEPKYINPLVELFYSAYPYKHYSPPFPPCKNGLCLICSAYRESEYCSIEGRIWFVFSSVVPASNVFVWVFRFYPYSTAVISLLWTLLLFRFGLALGAEETLGLEKRKE